MENSKRSTTESTESRSADSAPFLSTPSIPQFDLGGDGRQPWYVPNERTLFPAKKGVASSLLRKQPSQDGQDKQPKIEEKEDGPQSTVLWDITAHEVERFVRGESSSAVQELSRFPIGEGDDNERALGAAPLLRRRESLEEEVKGIVDDEERRLTGIAYLT